MIVVQANLIPFGDPEAQQTILCKVEIANIGGTRTRGMYEVRLYSKEPCRLIRTAFIEDWPRLSKPAWRLIAKAFEVLEVS